MRCRRVWGGGRKRPGAQRSFLDLESERTHHQDKTEHVRCLKQEGTDESELIRFTVPNANNSSLPTTSLETDRATDEG